MNNWYKTSKLNNELNVIKRTSGIKENITISLLLACISVMTGSAIWNASKKYNVPENQIEQTINDQEFQNAFSEGKFNHIKNLSDDDLSLDPIPYSPTNLEQTVKEQNDNEEKNQEESRENLTPLDVAARTIYDEARGEGENGMKYVAQVIANRSDGTPESVKDVCLQPWQFSGWNNNRLIPKGTGQEWDYSLKLAQKIIQGEIEPDPKGYTNFCNPNRVLRNNGINAPELNSLSDLQKLPLRSLQALPSFMFYPQRENLPGGAWKNIYPRTRENLRKEFTVLGNHFFYR